LEPLGLAIDSMLAAIALSTVVNRRQALVLSVMFGVCDGVASFIAPNLPFHIRGGDSIAGIFLSVWGVLILLQLPWLRVICRSSRLAYGFPALLALDNLLMSGDALTAGLVSAAMAATGFLLGAWFTAGLQKPLPPDLVRGGIMAFAGAMMLAKQPAWRTCVKGLLER
jgi:hypothetical protein